MTHYALTAAIDENDLFGAQLIQRNAGINMFYVMVDSDIAKVIAVQDRLHVLFGINTDIKEI